MPTLLNRGDIISSGTEGSRMSESPKDKDQEKGDEVLRRLLKTPPDPKTGKEKEPHEKRSPNKGHSGKSGNAVRPAVPRSD